MAIVFLSNGKLFNKVETSARISPFMQDGDCQKLVLFGVQGTDLDEEMTDGSNEEAHEIFKEGRATDNNFSRVVKSGDGFLLRHTVVKSTTHSIDEAINVLQSTHQLFGIQFSVGNLNSNGFSQGHCLLVWFEDGQVHFWDFLGEHINQLVYCGLSLEDVRRKQKGTLIVSSWVLYTFRACQIRHSKSKIGTDGEFELRKCRK